jgi:hypothetical protein
MSDPEILPLPIKRGRGRPKGSKNKPKPGRPVPIAAAPKPIPKPQPRPERQTQPPKPPKAARPSPQPAAAKPPPPTYMSPKKIPEPRLPFSVEGFVSFYELMLIDRNIRCPDHFLPVARALCDERISKLLILLGPGSGKSILASIAYPAFVLGCRPHETVLGVSAGETLMQGFQKTVMDWIEFSPQWKMLFPGVRPDKDAGWSTDRGIYVTGRHLGNPDASYFVAGLTSSALTGKHARYIILDDIHNRENAATAAQCQRVRDAWYDTLVGRADPAGARFIAIGRRWSQEDIYGHWKSLGEFVTMELPMFREKTEDGVRHGALYWDVTVPDGLNCVFTDQSCPDCVEVK